MNNYIAIALLAAFIFGLAYFTMHQIGEMPEYEYVPLGDKMIQIERGV